MSDTWLEELEAAVREAGKTIESLRREKAELEARVKELEARASSDAEDDGASAWEDERREIRGRVEKLTERLGALLEDE